MKLYIAASEYTIGSMLAQQDENGVERAIYYLSRVLNDAETRYHPSGSGMVTSKIFLLPLFF